MENRVLKKLHDSEVAILDEFVKICKKNNLKYFLVGGTLLGSARHNGFIPWDDDLDVGMPREDFEKFVKIYYKDLDSKFLFDYFTVNKLYCYPFAKIRIKNSIFLEKKLKEYSGNKGIWIDIFPVDNANDLSKASKQKKKMNKFQIIMMVKCGEISGNIVKKTIKKLLSLFLNNKFLGNNMNRIMCKQNNNKDNKYYINLGSQYSIEKQSHLIEKYYPLKKLKFEEKEYNVPNDYDYVLKKIYGENYMELPPEEKRVTHNPLKIVFEDGEEVIFDEEI